VITSSATTLVIISAAARSGTRATSAARSRSRQRAPLEPRFTDDKDHDAGSRIVGAVMTESLAVYEETPEQPAGSTVRAPHRKSPVCTENFVRIDPVRESSNCGRDGPVNFAVLEPVCDSLQVQEPT
jgi:hypothetical protein